MRKKRTLNPILLVLLTMLVSMMPAASFAEEATGNRSTAFAQLGEPIVTQNMTFVDGMEREITDSADPLYSELFEMQGIHARKVYKENYVYFQLDKDFYQPTDRDFVVEVEYWDFGPDPGWFHVEYNSSDGTANKRISIQKTGKVQKWCTIRIFINDAAFARRMDENADIRLVSNAYNAFSKITVYNIAAAMRNNEMPEIKNVNVEEAERLYSLGMYKGVSETEYAPGLEQTLTRYELLSVMLDGLLEKEKAVEAKEACSFADVSAEQAALVGYAEKNRWILGNEKKEFRPDDIATPREALTIYLRLLGYRDENLYDIAFDKAMDIGLLANKNIVISGDIELTRDHFVAMAYNYLSVRNVQTNLNGVEKMVTDGALTAKDLEGTEFEGAMYTKPVTIEKRTIFDETAGREYYYMNINGARAIRPYITNQHWSSDGTRFFLHNDVHKALYEYNIETEQLRKLDDTVSASGGTSAIVTPSDHIYYRRTAREYYIMDWNTGKTKKVADIPEGVETGDPSITDDLKYATTFWKKGDEPADYLNGVGRCHIAPRLDLSTGEWDTSLRHEFNDQPDYPTMTHQQINPVDPDLIMFAHEGTTDYIHDRIWLGRVSTGETWNLFKQARRTDAYTAETTGHEVWAPDGQSVYFVKYYYPSLNLGQQGIVRVDLEGNREYINGDYRYWHCHPSRDNNWVVADTQLGSSSEIVLIDTNTYESHVLAKINTPNNPLHPYQPHPMISPDGRYVSWQMVDETGMLGIGWADITEFTQNTVENERIALSDGIEMITNPKGINRTVKLEDKGEAYYQAAADRGIYFDIAEEAAADVKKDITLRITYQDNGRQWFNIYYTGAVETDADLANRENKMIDILRTGTGRWVTTEITLKDMNLSNAGKFKSDFYITGNMYSSVKIKNIEIVK